MSAPGGDFISLQRVRSQAADDPKLVAEVLRQLGPVGGDYVVIRAEPSRAEAIEANLVTQLFPQGARLAGPPVEGYAEQDEDHDLWVNEEGTILVRNWRDGSAEMATRDRRGDSWGPPVMLRQE